MRANFESLLDNDFVAKVTLVRRHPGTVREVFGDDVADAVAGVWPEMHSNDQLSIVPEWFVGTELEKTLVAMRLLWISRSVRKNAGFNVRCW